MRKGSQETVSLYQADTELTSNEMISVCSGVQSSHVCFQWGKNWDNITGRKAVTTVYFCEVSQA